MLRLAVLLLALQACASAPNREPVNAATFRRTQAIEFYDFRLNASHDGRGGAVRGRDCSSDRFHCYAGLTVLIAPRDCGDLRRLLRARSGWTVEDRASARFLFRSEDQYYFASTAEDRGPLASASSGFVYDLDRGVIGVWRSDAAQHQLTREGARMIVDSTKWLEAPQSLFACS